MSSQVLPPTNGYFQSIRIESCSGKSALEYYQCKDLVERSRSTIVFGMKEALGDKKKVEKKENCEPTHAIVDWFKFFTENKELRVLHQGYEFLSCDGKEIAKHMFEKLPSAFPLRSFPVKCNDDQLVFATTLRNDSNKMCTTHYVGHYDGNKLFISAGKSIFMATFYPT